MEHTQDNISQERALTELKRGFKQSEKIIKEDRIGETLQRLEEKLKSLPNVGEQLSHIAVFASLLNSYVKKEYTKVPIGTITAIVSAILYVISPIDIITDIIPGLGYLDDAAVVLACFCLVESDIQEYLAWREEQSKTEK